jgi:hypothetical protein
MEEIEESFVVPPRSVEPRRHNGHAEKELLPVSRRARRVVVVLFPHIRVHSRYSRANPKIAKVELRAFSFAVLCEMNVLHPINSTVANRQHRLASTAKFPGKSGIELRGTGLANSQVTLFHFFPARGSVLASLASHYHCSCCPQHGVEPTGARPLANAHRVSGLGAYNRWLGAQFRADYQLTDSWSRDPPFVGGELSVGGIAVCAGCVSIS